VRADTKHEAEPIPIAPPARYCFTREIESAEDGNTEIASQLVDVTLIVPDNKVAVASIVPVPDIVQSGALGTLPRGTV
jgi:hypothetical protein